MSAHAAARNATHLLARHPRCTFGHELGEGPLSPVNMKDLQLGLLSYLSSEPVHNALTSDVGTGSLSRDGQPYLVGLRFDLGKPSVRKHAARDLQ